MDFTDQNEDEDNIFYYGGKTNQPIEYNFYESNQGLNKLNLKKIKEEDDAYNEDYNIKGQIQDLGEILEEDEELEMEVKYEFKEDIPEDFDFYLRLPKKEELIPKKDRSKGKKGVN